MVVTLQFSVGEPRVPREPSSCHACHVAAATRVLHRYPEDAAVVSSVLTSLRIQLEDSLAVTSARDQHRDWQVLVTVVLVVLVHHLKFKFASTT